jgi:hypothetical protein
VSDRRFVLIRRQIGDVAGDRAGPDEIIVPKVAIFAAERAEQKKGQSDDFKQTAPVRAANIHAPALWTTPNHQQAMMAHRYAHSKLGVFATAIFLDLLLP